MLRFRRGYSSRPDHQAPGGTPRGDDPQWKVQPGCRGLPRLLLQSPTVVLDDVIHGNVTPSTLESMISKLEKGSEAV